MAHRHARNGKAYMLTGHYEPLLVSVSVLVAIFASYTALSLAGRVRQSRGSAALWWTVGGALAMGSGIWAMHFIGMLAFRLPIPLGYDFHITFLSWLLPVTVSAMALWQLRDPKAGPRQLMSGAVLFGLGINAMHYAGMAALLMDPAIVYSAPLVLASVAIAVAAAAGALWIAFRLGNEPRHPRLVQLAAASLMGVAIAGMHYTGMAAANFPLGSVCGAAEGGVSPDALAVLVTLAIVAVLSIALLVAAYEARLQARARSLQASLASAAAQQELYLREQKARVQAEQLSQLKDEFLATLSHELRTPLNAMLGWSQLLLQGNGDEAMWRRGLETIERNARAQSRLIEDMLDMSRLIAGQMRLDVKPVWPAEFIEAAIETARPAALARQVGLHVRLDGGAGPILGDAGRMQQVMANLLSNAVKFTEAGGRVEVSLAREGGQARIAVRDSGVGISEAFLPHVFDRFRQADASSTRRHGGLGLGLAIARQLVELQGGTISAASAGHGKGAEFSLRFPLQTMPALERVDPRPVAEPAPASVDLSGLSVLIVEDQPDSLELVQQVVASTGATVLTASGAEQALLLMERHQPRLLISDIGLPGMDGFTLIERVRGLERGQAAGPLVAIALTAFSRREDQARALDAGFDAFLAKPFMPSVLLRTLTRLLDAPSRHPAAHPAVI